MLSNLADWGSLFASLGLLLTLVWVLPPQHPAGRAIGAALCVGLAVRFFVWRVLYSMPVGQNTLQQIWAWLFLVAEGLATLSQCLLFFFLSRTVDRRAEADAGQDSPLQDAPVDILIATYNEAEDILERTIVGALAIDHRDKRVWVLDDGSRDWLRALADELGAFYVRRTDRTHAKAGNVNNGLKVALTTGRRPAFVLLLDADFVANRTILRRTLGLFDSPDVGIVQTPQHFFNPDPIQANLLCAGVWPDEQRFFFNALLPAKDAWGAAFCCGTSAVLRVAAIEKTRGLATDTVTEDMLTSFALREHGWRTILLNERLSLGLAPEGLKEYLSQRGRWCLGAIQQLHTRFSPLAPGKMSLINRISCIDGMLFWSASYMFRVMMMLAPVLYWWTGTMVLNGTFSEFIRYLVPPVVLASTFTSIYGRNTVLPVISDISHLLVTPVILRSVVAGIFAPADQPFRVTAKGLSSQGVTVQWKVLRPLAVLAALLTLGMLANASPYSKLAGSDGFAINVVWTLLDLTLLMIAIAACVELPRPRRDERFSADERAVVVWPGRTGVECQLRNISLGGAMVEASPDASNPWRSVGTSGLLMLDDGALAIPFVAVRKPGDVEAGRLSMRFNLAPRLRRRLIERLFTGRYDNDIETVSARRVAATIFRQIFA